MAATHTSDEHEPTSDVYTTSCVSKSYDDATTIIVLPVPHMVYHELCCPVCGVHDGCGSGTVSKSVDESAVKSCVLAIGWLLLQTPIGERQSLEPCEKFTVTGPVPSSARTITAYSTPASAQNESEP